MSDLTEKYTTKAPFRNGSSHPYKYVLILQFVT